MKQQELSAGLVGALTVAGLWILTENKVPQKLLRVAQEFLRGERRRHNNRRPGDGYTLATKDLSLFYAMDTQALTTTTTEMKHLPNEIYGEIVRLMPVICIDLAIESDEGTFLLVRRAADPVKGFFWWPGGRLFKGETFFAAARRKCVQETGVEAMPVGVVGVFNTFFGTSAWENAGTHTINVVVHMRVGAEGAKAVKLDDTSEEARWIHPRDAKAYDTYVQEILRAVATGVCL